MIDRDFVLRPSSFPTWQDCPRRFAGRTFAPLLKSMGWKIRETGSTIGALVGIGLHAGAAYTLTTKLETGELGANDEAEDRAIAGFEERADAEACIYDQTTRDRGTAKKQIVRMVDTYRRRIAPKISPVAVERRLKADVGGGFVLSGQVDAMAIAVIREALGIRDLKSGVTQRGNAAQYGAYSLLFRSHDYDIRELGEDYLERVRIKEPQPIPEFTEVPIGPAENEALDIIDEVKAAFDEFERRLEKGGRPPEGAFRANPQSLLCSDKYCPAWGTDFCRAHKGAK